MAEAGKTYNKDDTVEQDGNYVCVPCGYNRYFRKGEQFTECMSCLSGTKDGHEEFAAGLELWEKSPDQKPQ
ncbi:MAG: hypothetical protein HY420_00525 [Candidatus Kerfeldbacteria bacterium]|nr:hypothetical protein [Candidatus Kerfeldbacteria bacterium]